MLKELPIELQNRLPLPPDVFLFVNPLNGKHAKFKDGDALAVFKDGKLIWREPGVKPAAQLVQIISKL